MPTRKIPTKGRRAVITEGLLAYLHGMPAKDVDKQFPSDYGTIYFDFWCFRGLAPELVEMWEQVKDETPLGTPPPWKRKDWWGYSCLCATCPAGWFEWNYARNCGVCTSCGQTIPTMFAAYKAWHEKALESK